MKQHHDRARIEVLLSERAEEGLTFRELSERSGVPVPTLSYYAGKLGMRKQRRQAELVQVELADDLQDQPIRIDLGEGLELLAQPGFDPVRLAQALSSFSR